VHFSQFLVKNDGAFALNPIRRGRQFVHSPSTRSRRHLKHFVSFMRSKTKSGRMLFLKEHTGQYWGRIESQSISLTRVHLSHCHWFSVILTDEWSNISSLRCYEDWEGSSNGTSFYSSFWGLTIEISLIDYASISFSLISLIISSFFIA